MGILVQGDNNLVETTLSLKNSQIYNSENVNLWAKTAVIRSENLVLGAAGISPYLATREEITALYIQP